VCWCGDEYTGEALGEVVPQPMMEMLPCCAYFFSCTRLQLKMLLKIHADNATVVGDSYLRLCDSAEYALNAIQEEMVTHGTLGAAFVSNNCGLDGSYGPYQFEIGRWWKVNKELCNIFKLLFFRRFCSWKDRSAIGSFATEQIPEGGLTCSKYISVDQTRCKLLNFEGYSRLPQRKIKELFLNVTNAEEHRLAMTSEFNLQINDYFLTNFFLEE
jgi:hypothetical protein